MPTTHDTPKQKISMPQTSPEHNYPCLLHLATLPQPRGKARKGEENDPREKGATEIIQIIQG